VTLAKSINIPDAWWEKLPRNPYGPEFTQLALYCSDIVGLDVVVDIARRLGYDEWVTDLAFHRGWVFNSDRPTFHVQATAIDAHMAFNYQIIPDVEFELMSWRPISDHPIHDHPFKRKYNEPTMTYRVECVFTEEARLLEQFGLRSCYRFITATHENPNVFGKARYSDTMFDTYDELGYNLRACMKLPHEPYFVVPRGSGVELNPVHFRHTISDSEFIDGKWYRHGWEPK
jgi:hypothetical protein